MQLFFFGLFYLWTHINFFYTSHSYFFIGLETIKTKHWPSKTQNFFIYFLPTCMLHMFRKCILENFLSAVEYLIIWLHSIWFIYLGGHWCVVILDMRTGKCNIVFGHVKFIFLWQNIYIISLHNNICPKDACKLRCSYSKKGDYKGCTLNYGYHYCFLIFPLLLSSHI